MLHELAKRRTVEASAGAITPDPRDRARWDLDDLHREIEAAGVSMQDWPFPHDTAAGIDASIAYRHELAKVMAEADPPGSHVFWQLDRERALWDADPRNPAARGEPVGAREGPPPDGLDIATIRAALRDWTGEWPPPQDQITGYTGRRVRQVLHEARTSWQAEVEAIKR